MIFNLQTGYFGNLLASLRGSSLRREIGEQNSGGSGGAGAGKPVNSETALQLSAVWACVKLIAESVGSMPIRVWRIEDNGTKVEDKTHPLYVLLNYRPNRYQTRNEFFETLIINLLLNGNFYGRIAWKGKPYDSEILSILSMTASQTEVSLLNSGDRVYKFTDGGNIIVSAQENTWHVLAMPGNAIVGLSTLQYGARTMGIAMAAEDRVASLAANGFKAGGVLMIDKILKPEQRAQIRKEFADLQEGKGDPLKVLEAGMKYQQITFAPKDIQLLETRRFSVEDICRFFGVPSVLVNDTTATSKWGTGIGEIKEGFYTLVLQPLLERLESSANRWLLPPVQRQKYEIEFDFSNFLRGDETSRIERFTKAISGLLLTPDEARAKYDNLAPYPGGIGAKPVAQSQYVPLGSAPPPSDKKEAPPNDDSKPPAD